MLWRAGGRSLSASTAAKSRIFPYGLIDERVRFEWVSVAEWALLDERAMSSLTEFAYKHTGMCVGWLDFVSKHYTWLMLMAYRSYNMQINQFNHFKLDWIHNINFTDMCLHIHITQTCTYTPTHQMHYSIIDYYNYRIIYAHAHTQKPIQTSAAQRPGKFGILLDYYSFRCRWFDLLYVNKFAHKSWTCVSGEGEGGAAHWLLCMYRTYIRLHMHHPLAINFTRIKTPCRTACNIMRILSFANILVARLRGFIGCVLWGVWYGRFGWHGAVSVWWGGFGVDSGCARVNFSNTFLWKF